MPSYWRSLPGRVFIFELGLAVAFVGVLAFVGPEGGEVVLPYGPLTCAGISIFAIGLGLDRYPVYSLALVLILPFIGGLYLMTLYAAMAGGMGLAVPAFIVGGAAMAFSLFGGAPDESDSASAGGAHSAA